MVNENSEKLVYLIDRLEKMRPDENQDQLSGYLEAKSDMEHIVKQADSVLDLLVVALEGAMKSDWTDSNNSPEEDVIHWCEEAISEYNKLRGIEND